MPLSIVTGLYALQHTQIIDEVFTQVVSTGV